MNYLEKRREDHEPTILTPLLLGSIGISLIFTLANVGYLVETVGTARLRDLELFQLLHRVLGLVDREPLVSLPPLANRAFHLRTVRPLLSFSGLAVAASLLIYVAITLLSAPFLMLFQRISRSLLSERGWRWLWETAFPVTMLVLLGAPFYLSVIHRWFPGRRLATVGVAMVFLLLLWLFFIAIFRRPTMIRGLLLWIGSVGSGLTLIALLASLVSAVNISSKKAQTQRSRSADYPNILLVSIDTLRADHLGCYGYFRETSPRIDAVAREGALFKTVVSPTSWTLPAHITLLTSLPPEGHRVVDDGMRAGEDALFLAEVLRDAGYTTAGFVAGPYLSGSYGFLQGFGYYDDFTVAGQSHQASHHGVTSPTSIRITREWLEKWDVYGRRQPFFIFLHLWDVHYDFVPPPPYDTMFDSNYNGSITGKNFEKGSHIHSGMDEQDRQHIVALYDGEIRFTDEHLGTLFDRLETMAVFDHTIVVITSDHGEEFFEHGRKGHRKSLFDETILIPLIIRFPRKIPAEVIVERQVRLMDVAPTILSLAGVVRPEGFGGSTTLLHGARDLSPLLDPMTAETFENLLGFSDLHGNLKSVRSGSAKMIRSMQHNSRGEIYDLLADPGEEINLRSSNSLFVQFLDQQLQSWLEAWSHGSLEAEKAEINESLKERLRSLGYIE